MLEKMDVELRKAVSESVGQALASGTLPDKSPLGLELIIELGVSEDEAGEVLSKLLTGRRKTWGNLLALENRDEAIEVLGGDKVNGPTIWNGVRKYKDKATVNGPAAGTSGLNILGKVPVTANGVQGFVISDVIEKDSRIRLDSDETRQHRVIELRQSLWGDAKMTKALWLRDCYFDLSKIVRAKLRLEDGFALIAGSRGIGKSVFGLLLLVDLVKEGHVVLYEHKGRRMLIMDESFLPEQKKTVDDACTANSYAQLSPGVYEFFSKDESLWISLIDSTELTHIQDLGETVTQINRNGKGRKIIVTSPNNTQLQSLHSAKGVLKLYMPTWTLDELEQARYHCYPHLTKDTVEARVEMYGGIPRFVLDLSEEEMTAKVQDSLGKLTIDQLANLFRTRDIENLPSQRETGYFVHLVPEKRYDGPLDLKLGDAVLDELSRKYRRFMCRFGSEYLQQRIAERFIEDQRFTQEHFARAVEGISEFRSLFGYMLEAHGHRVLRKGGEKTLKHLEGGKSITKFPPPELHSAEPFRKLKDVEVVKPNVYFRPMRKNYPTWDSFTVLRNSEFAPTKLSCVLFQFACGEQHDVGGPDIRDTQKLVFEKIPASEFPTPSKRLKPLDEDDLEMVLVFGTTKSGIRTAQKVKTGEGKNYVAKSGKKPNVAQYAMIMDDTFHKLAEMVQHQND